MHIERVRLENFKGYAFAEIPLEPGVTAILGLNGAGKSSILEAIKYALFGLRPGTASELLREGTKSGSIEINLRLGEHVYFVERRFNAKGTTRYRIYASPRPDADILAEGVRGVQAWLRDRLHISPDSDMGTLFENTGGVPQGMMATAFRLAPGLRKLVFDPLLQVQDFRKASDNLRPTNGQLADQASVQKANLARLEGMQEGLPDLQEEGRELEKEISKLGDTLDQSRSSLVSAESNMHFLDKAQSQSEEADKRAEEAKTHLEAHEPIVAATQKALVEAEAATQVIKHNLLAHTAYSQADTELQNLEPSRTLRDGLLREQADAKADLARYVGAKAREPACQQRLEQWAARVGEIEAALVEASQTGKLIEDWDASIEEARAMSNQHRQLIGAIEGMLDRLNRQTALLTDSEIAVCPTCGTELTTDHRQHLLDETQSKIAEHGEQLAEGRQSLSILSAQMTAAQSRQAAGRAKLRLMPTVLQLDRAREEYEQSQTDLTALRAEIVQADAAQARVDRLNGELNQYAGLDAILSRFQESRRDNQAGHDTYMSNLSLAGHLPKRQEAHAEALSELARLKRWVESTRVTAEMERVAYDQQLHETVKRQAEQCRDDIVAGEAKLMLKGDRLTVVRMKLLELERVEAKRAALVADLALTEKTQKTLQWARGVLREAGPYVTQRLVRQVSQHASEIYADLTGDADKRLDWSEDYAASLRVGPYTRNFSSQLSGGEQMSVALALRLALLREMSGIDVAFFDEPTANLDADRRGSLAESISQVRGLSQVVVISHDDTFEPAAETIIRVVSDEGGSHASTE